MATGSFILRPSGDISLDHVLTPSTLASGYLAINESVCDGDSTYLKCYASGYAEKDDTNQMESQFNLGGTIPNLYFQI